MHGLPPYMLVLLELIPTLGNILLKSAINPSKLAHEAFLLPFS